MDGQRMVNSCGWLMLVSETIQLAINYQLTIDQPSFTSRQFTIANEHELLLQSKCMNDNIEVSNY